jgi:hypothetical protein
MSLASMKLLNCPTCNHAQECLIYESVNVSLNPELKERFLNDDLNLFECENCNESCQIVFSGFIYHDSNEKRWLQYFDTENGYLARKKMLDSMAKKWEYRITIFFDFEQLRDYARRLYKSDV